MRTRACMSIAVAAALSALSALSAGSALAGEPTAPQADGATVVTQAQDLIKQGKTEQAIAALQRAVQADPKLTDAWVLLGNTQLGVARTQQAINAYKRALALDASLQDVRYNLAYAYRQTEQYENAVKAYQTYLKGAPNDADALYGLAESLKGDEQWAAAAAAFDRYAAAETRPNQAKWADKARVEAEQLRQKAQAEGDTAVASGSSLPGAGVPAPSAGAVVPASTEGAAAAGTQQAPPQASAGVEGDPADPASADATADAIAVAPAGARPASFKDGLELLRTGAFTEALARLKAAADEADDDPVVLSALGSAHLGLEEAEPAILAYRRALAVGPSTTMVPAIQFGIAEAHRLMRNDRAAAVELKQVIADKATPDNLRALAQERLAALSL